MALDIVIDGTLVPSIKIDLLLRKYSYAKVLSEPSAKAVLNAANTKHFWLVTDEDIDSFDFGADTGQIEHKFEARCVANRRCSVILVNRLELVKMVARGKIKTVQDILHFIVEDVIIKCSRNEIDESNSIVLLSYHEPQAETLFQSLVEKYGSRVKHIKNVRGIVNAHHKAAEMSDTELFYVVDADAKILEPFNFDYLPPIEDRRFVHIWRSINPVNGLTYGYGGIKMFAKQMFSRPAEQFIDLTTSIATEGTKVMTDISNITAFNTSAESTWRSAFRECTKLASKIIHRTNDLETNFHLDIWTSIGEGEFGMYCLHGARAGKMFGEKNKNNLSELNRINDFEWLATEFRSYFGL